MQIKQALHGIGPEAAVGISFGKAVGVTQQMDHQTGRFLPSGRLQCGIELAEEADVRLAGATIDGQIEPRRANQIQSRIQSPCSKDSSDRDSFGMELMKSGNQ